jgi:hypothetical protein
LFSYSSCPCLDFLAFKSLLAGSMISQTIDKKLENLRRRRPRVPMEIRPNGQRSRAILTEIEAKIKT